ncbi:MAG: LacI family transcriptional regulator [Hyphomicrobiales bacterium]|nr:LacI family transcriptional regulator [Hyphomicrobiales bacterium]
MSRKITLTTIAKHLEISTATVSLALRDSPLIAELTRQRVKTVAQEMGYIYNRRAAALRTSKSGIIGVVIHEIMNPFFAEILIAIEDELRLNTQTFLLCNHRDQLDIQTDFIHTLMQFGADGVIISPAIDTTADDISKIEANNLPVVMIARSVNGVKVPTFRGDDKKGIYMATRHLLRSGHKDIAFIGGRRETSTGRDRRAGYLTALEEVQIPPRPEFQMGSESTRLAGYQCIMTMFAKGIKPTAVVCFNDLVAIGVMNGLRDMGLEPGRDVSVTGYDDISEAEISAPALTSVWNGQQEVGRMAAKAMISILAGEEPARERVLIEPQLRIRESTGVLEEK